RTEGGAPHRVSPPPPPPRPPPPPPPGPHDNRTPRRGRVVALAPGGAREPLQFACARPPLPWIVGRREPHLIHWVRGQHEAPFVAGDLDAVPDDCHFAPDWRARNDSQAFVAILRDLCRGQPVQRETGQRMPEDDAQHVKLTVGSAL